MDRKKIIIIGTSAGVCLLLIVCLLLLIPGKEEFRLQELLDHPSGQNAQLIQKHFEKSKESEKQEILDTIGNWIEESLEDYKTETLTQGQMEERLAFLQTAGVSDSAAILEWTRSKNEISDCLKGKSLYEEALEWFEAGQYQLARESAGMVRESAGEYYQKARDLIQLCGEKEEEANRLQEEALRQNYLDELAAIYRRYARMTVENVREAGDLMGQYDQILGQLKSLSAGAQLVEQAKKEYPLEAWKIECKKLILGNIADGNWPEDTGFILRETAGVPFVIIQTPDEVSVYIWSKTTLEWSTLEYDGYSCMGMNMEEMSFLFRKESESEEAYAWLLLGKSGWEPVDFLQKKEEEYRVLWLFPAIRTVYLQNGQKINQKAYERSILLYQEKCEGQGLTKISANALSEALGDLKL